MILANLKKHNVIPYYNLVIFHCWRKRGTQIIARVAIFLPGFRHPVFFKTYIHPAMAIVTVKKFIYITQRVNDLVKIVFVMFHLDFHLVEHTVLVMTHDYLKIDKFYDVNIKFLNMYILLKMCSALKKQLIYNEGFRENNVYL